jgi:hypothetical protein
MAWGRLAIQAIRKMIRIEAFRFAAARRWIGRYSKTDSADAEPLRFKVGKSNLLRRLHEWSEPPLVIEIGNPKGSRRGPDHRLCWCVSTCAMG